MTTLARHARSRLPAAAATLARAIRDHGSLAQRRHWGRAVAVRQDDRRGRTAHAPAPRALLRHVARTRLRLAPARRTARATTRLPAALDATSLRTALDRVTT